MTSLLSVQNWISSLKYQ